MNINIIFANILGGRKFTGTIYGESDFGDDVLDEYARIIGEHQPDIVSLAEVHLDDETHSEQVAKLSQLLNLPHYDIQGTDKSHLAEGKILGNAVLSKYPIIASDHFLIKAPALEVDRPNGDQWVLHDKGAQTVQIDITGRVLSLTNLQYFPFHHFLRAGNDPAFAPERKMLVDQLTNVQDGTISIVTGDFNNKNFSLKESFPELFDAGFAEAQEENTTIVGDSQQLDHILYKPEQAEVTSAEIFDTPSDHLALRASLTFRE
ncbi:MAG: endonuclease/exonuclease/phosphatase family protein [Candidatus Saccharimonas sp.]